MTLVERLLAQDAALNMIEGLKIADNDRTAKQAADRIRELEAALLDLYSGTAEYVYLNHLGDPNNTTPMRNAAKALGASALEAYDRLRALYSTSETAPEPTAFSRKFTGKSRDVPCELCGKPFMEHSNFNLACSASKIKVDREQS